jgi:hypothetical protein
VISVLCKICAKTLTSNRSLGFHIVSDHQMTPTDYFKMYPDATKYCSRCKKELPIRDFFLDRDRPIGYRTQCIHCMRPGSKKSRCPLCHRLLQQSAMVTHLGSAHGILPIISYHIYLKEKYCPRCKAVKPLDQFYRLNDDVQAYSSYCRNCHRLRTKQYYSRKKLHAPTRLSPDLVKCSNLKD